MRFQITRVNTMLGTTGKISSIQLILFGIELYYSKDFITIGRVST